MGGKAFTTGPAPLLTPRMPPQTYRTLTTHLLTLLSTLYHRAQTPLPSPNKSTHGDIDILVSDPLSPTSPPTTETLTKELAAERVSTTPNSATTSFALPYPDLPGNHVQLDVHVCRPETFEWQLFLQSHGDLWNLLGTTIRPFGLTANDVGLHLRIAEIEGRDRRRSMVFLTREPDVVLDFLGLDAGVYWRGFESLEAMYRYVVGCRFFRRERYVRGELKANDRKRLKQREVYRGFVEGWLGENEGLVGGMVEGRREVGREEVEEEVLERWGKREVYWGVVGRWRREREELEVRREGRQRRKAEAAEGEEYADAWMRWIKHDSTKA